LLHRVWQELLNSAMVDTCVERGTGSGWLGVPFLNSPMLKALDSRVSVVEEVVEGCLYSLKSPLWEWS
jgi:hypothetical protein